MSATENLWVRTAVNHNKNLGASQIIYVFGEETAKICNETVLIFVPLLIFVWPLEFHIWKLCPGVTSRLIMVKVQEHFTGPHSEPNMLRSIKHKSLVMTLTILAQIFFIFFTEFAAMIYPQLMTHSF